MTQRTTQLLKAVLAALHYTGADRLLEPMTRGDGVIFMLHHVRPEPPSAFEPNRILKITPDFLDQVLRQVIETGFEILSLDEAHARLTGAEPAGGGTGHGKRRPFVCFTCDDGYRDNKAFAYPVFKRYGAPFTIYVPTDYPDGHGTLWWLDLEAVVREARAVAVQMEGELRTLPCRSTEEKYKTFEQIYWWLRSIPEDRARQVVADLSAGIGLDARRQLSDQIMSWGEIRALAVDPLVTIGAHTRRHLALAKLGAEEANSEIAGSIARVEAELGRPCRHFSYPYGDAASAGPRDFRLAAAAGLKTAVTTRKGVLHRGTTTDLMALPRVSLNGDYQDRRYVKVFLSGAPFAMLNALSGRGRAASPA